MKRLALALLFLLFAVPAHAQNCSGQPAANTVCAAPNGSAGMPSFRSVVGADLPVGTNTGTQSTQTGDFTVQTTDCGKTFLFSSSSAQHTVTAAAASGFTAGCKFWVVNTGVYTGSGSARGLLLSSISGASFPTQGSVLYPGQVTEFTNISSTWVETGYPWRARWKPNTNITIFADASSGSDNNDCLASGASACATIGNSYYRAFNYIDTSWLGISNLNPMVLLSTNGTFATGDTLHLAGPMPGGGNNTVFVLNGNGTTTMTSSSGQPCVAMFDHSVMEVIGITCNGTVGNAGCFTVASGAVMFFITTGVTCDPGTLNVMTAQDPGSKIEIVNVNITINSASGTPANYFVASQGGAIVWDNAESVSLGANMTLSGFPAVATELGLLHFAGTTFNLNAHTITATRFFCSRFGVIQGTGGTPNTFFPGNVNGTSGADCSTT